MARLKLTNTSIRESCTPPPPEETTKSGAPVLQRLYVDTELRGFGVLVTRSTGERPPTKTFVVQRRVQGRIVRVKIGRFGDLPCEEARKRAQILIAGMLKGENPNKEKKAQQARGITLADAAASYRDKPAKRTRATKAKLTLDRHDYYVRVLEEWSASPLRDIRRHDVLRVHKRISADRGKVAANNVLRWFRSVYNAALMIHEELPPNPCVVLSDYWNRERRIRSPIPWPDLPRWFSTINLQLRARNPVRADLHLFYLFSGLRRTDACTIQISEIDAARQTIFRPRPKGGEDRAYDLPLSSALIAIVERRIKGNHALFGERCPWLFPTFDKSGLVTHTKEPKEKGLPSPHRLRDTYAEAAHEAGIKQLDQKILMNHLLPEGADVTDDYKRPPLDYLLTQQEIVTAFLLRKLFGANSSESDRPRHGLFQVAGA